MIVQSTRTIHSTSHFTSLLVTPSDWSKVGLVVHKPTVEKWFNIGICGLDMNLERDIRENIINFYSYLKVYLSTTCRIFLEVSINRGLKVGK